MICQGHCELFVSKIHLCELVLLEMSIELCNIAVVLLLFCFFVQNIKGTVFSWFICLFPSQKNV